MTIVGDGRGQANWYFAYGSNMNPSRVQARGMGFGDAVAGTLHGFALHFNKRSTIHPGMAAANVCPVPDTSVEGVLYQMSSPDQIRQMDPFEGYPTRYTREARHILCDGRSVSAWVYIATQAYVCDGLRPARWYLDHLLAGEQYLSEQYVAMLRGIECLPDSMSEPV